MQVNDAYSIYVQDKSSGNYDILGKALLKYIRAVIAQEFGNRVIYLEDAVGEVVMNVFANLSQFDESKGVFSRWVYGITFNTCINLLRERSKRNEQRLIGIEPVEERLPRIDRVILQSFLQKLPEDEQKLVASLRAGYSLADVAKRNEESPEAVRKRWSRLLERLRTLGGGNVGVS